MQQKIDYAMRQSLDARQQAEACMDNHVREQWLTVARTWDDLVRACEEMRREQEAALFAS